MALDYTDIIIRLAHAKVELEGAEMRAERAAESFRKRVSRLERQCGTIEKLDNGVYEVTHIDQLAVGVAEADRGQTEAFMSLSSAQRIVKLLEELAEAAK